jgi:cytochrome c oxidase subunit 1
MAKQESPAEVIDNEAQHDGDALHAAPGTFVLTLILLLSFAVYYFANWKALADVWHVR